MRFRKDGIDAIARAKAARDILAALVNRRDLRTPPNSSKSDSCRGDRRRDPAPKHTYAASTKDELKPGVVVFINNPTKKDDGTFETAAITVSRGGVNPPM